VAARTIPRGVRIGRNVLIGEGVRATDFQSRVVRSGSTVERPRERPARAATLAATAEGGEGRGSAASDQLLAGGTEGPAPEPVD
jgi:hypothetical protein